MPHLDPDRLRRQQYASAANLNARRALHQRFSTNSYGWQPWVFDHLLRLTPTDVVEIGAGPGALWQANLDRLPTRWRVTLSDFSSGMISEARNALSRHTQFQYAVFNAVRLALADATFDCVVANHMLYHVADRPAALREIARVLRPGGTFFAATNGDSHLLELSDLARRHGFDMESLDSAPFTLQNGEEQLRQVFGEVICERYEDSLRVTDADVLVAYLKSAIAAPGLAEMAALRAEIEAHIRRHGCVEIRKDVGIFAAKSAQP